MQHWMGRVYLGLEVGQVATHNVWWLPVAVSNHCLIMTYLMINLPHNTDQLLSPGPGATTCSLRAGRRGEWTAMLARCLQPFPCCIVWTQFFLRRHSSCSHGSKRKATEVRATLPRYGRGTSCCKLFSNAPFLTGSIIPCAFFFTGISLMELITKTLNCCAVSADRSEVAFSPNDSAAMDLVLAALGENGAFIGPGRDQQVFQASLQAKLLTGILPSPAGYTRQRD